MEKEIRRGEEKVKLSKEIIQQFVSYIDLDDVKNFALLHPELIKTEEKIFAISSFVISITIRPNINTEVSTLHQFRNFYIRFLK